MASKRSNLPALYELMGARGRSSPTVARKRVVSSPTPPPVAEETEGSWLSPGRMLRIQVGYLLLAVAFATALIVVAYSFGYKQAQEVVSQQYQQDLLMNTPAIGTLQTNDPLMGAVVEYPSTTGFSPVQDTPQEEPAFRESAQAVPESSPGWGAIFSDPRENGYNYFILIETSQEGARRVVRFCRENGLETYAIARKNGRLYRVIAVPGFKSSQRSGNEIRVLESLIHRVGDKWKREQSGTTDFRDKYPSLYTTS